MLLLPEKASGQELAPNLGAASGFALFTGTGASFANSGPTIVTGDIGSNASIISGFPVPGTVYGLTQVMNGVSAQVAADVSTAFSDMSGRTGGTVISTILGGQTLTPGTAAVSLGLDPLKFKGDLLSYNETIAGADKEKGWQYFDSYLGTAGFNQLESSKGYNFRVAEDDKITFTGKLNAAEHSFNNLKYTALGWNLLGNPYPCNYDLKGISALSDIGDGISNTVYFNHDGGYAYRNVALGAGTTGYTDTIAPMQGFFVLVSTAGTSLTLPVSYKTTGELLASRYKGASQSYIPLIVKKVKLVLKQGALSDETIVCLIDDATDGFDSNYDAYKLFGKSTSVPWIYSELGSVKYAINSLAGPVSDPVIVPVTVVIKTSGTYSINITEFENFDGLSVILKHGVAETILSENASYSFSSAAGTFSDFQLIFGSGLTDYENHTDEKLKSWYNDSYLYFNSPAGMSDTKGRLNVYDTWGRSVYTENNLFLSPGQTIQVPVNLPAGMYITQLLVNNRRYVSKIVVI